MISEIREIRLEDVLPKVFVGEEGHRSDVWQTSLTLRRGEHVLIEAASGTGKSSLCAYLTGSRTDYVGEIAFNGEDIRRLSLADWQRLRRSNIAYLPQELSLFPELTAMQNIMLKSDLTHHVDEKTVRGYLERLGIGHRADFPVGKMSIGQMQRVAIIRAICQPFDFIFLDEPVSHLDDENNRIAAAMVAEAAERQGAAIVATSVGNRLDLPEAKVLHL